MDSKRRSDVQEQQAVFLKYERSGHFFYLDIRTMLVKEKATSVKLAEP
jgi:hypothetical protein